MPRQKSNIVKFKLMSLILLCLCFVCSSHVVLHLFDFLIFFLCSNKSPFCKTHRNDLL